MSSVKSLIAVAVAGLALGASASAQVGSVPSIDVDVHSAAYAKLLKARAELASQAFQEEVTVPSSSGLVRTNSGQMRSFSFEGHALSLAGGEGGAPEIGLAILYAPSEGDDPGYRAAISAAAGGATVDYFDTRVATPNIATLLQYDAVYTWVNFAYANNVAFGDVLANYNDNGGNVVLGVFCTYTSGNSLSGAIMTPAYCPVDSPLGNNHFSVSNYVGNGTTCIYNGVAGLASQFRDFLVTQGSGTVDGTYADGEICHAYRSASGAGQGDVVYSNGSGAAQLPGSSGEWGAAVGNSCACGVGGPPAWTDEGSALAGVSGDPSLVGVGSMAPASAQTLTLSNAAGSALSALIASTSSAPTAFKGGVLLPGPSTYATLLTTSPGGGWSLAFRAPIVPSGSELWIQVAIKDAAAVQGVALSNGVKGTTP